MAKITRVGWTDRGWGAILERMVSADVQAIVGVIGTSADQQHDEDSPVTIGEVAQFNEFGTRTGVPARPFMTTALVWGAEAATKKILTKVVRNIVLGSPKAVALQEYGRWAVRRVVATMKSRVFVPNAQATIDKKGHDWTLRDSRKLISAITFKIVTGAINLRTMSYGGDE